MRNHALLLVATLAMLWTDGSVSQAAEPAGPPSARLNLAPLAKLTCTPAPHGDTLRAAVDGNPALAFVFAVHSAGEGSLTLTWDQPRRIDQVRILQGHNEYYSTAYQVTADRDGDGAFETTLCVANPAGAPKKWATHEIKPVVLKALRFESIAGISNGKRAHPVVFEIEAYGPVEPAALRELLRMGTRPNALPVLKHMCIDTPLVSDGKAVCTVLVPAGDAYRRLGEQVAEAIQTTLGAAPRVTSDMTQADPARGTVIAVGQMLNNKIIERLYWNRYVYLDSLCPGGDGYVVQTVHNPYPWTAGHNVVVLGGSTLAGAQRAAAEFATLLETARPSGSLGYVHRVQLPPPAVREKGYVLEGRNYTQIRMPERGLTEQEAQALVTAAPRTDLLAFRELGQKYLITGELPYLQAARRVLLGVAALYERDPDRHPTWPEETNARFIFATWDAVEEAPVFSDAERVRVTNLLLPFLYSLVRKTSDYGNLEKNDTIIWNHTTFPLLGLYWGGRYFRRYYDSAFMDTFLNEAEGAFRGQETCWKPQCDADSYLVLTMGHMIEYALAENRMAFFESGNIRMYADYLIGVCDNRGWAAGFGDSGMVRSTAIPDAGLPYAFWYTKEPGYLGYLNSIHDGHWVNPYHQDVAPEAPARSVGLRVYPLHRQVYEYTIKRSYYGEPSGPPNIPFEQAFDKIAFREDLQTTGQYLLLDGYARGKHLHYDGNAILKLADLGEDWLVDGDYLVRNTTEHTMVSVIRNGRAGKLVPECAGLLHEANLPGFGLTETQVKDYNGVDWHRGIFWRKGEWFVLIDRLLARQPGDYRLDCVFKCIDSGREELATPQRFRISRGGLYRFGNYGLEHTQATDGSRSAAVFSRPDAQLQFTVRLTKGQYRVTVLGAGPSTGADSLWLRVDGREPVAFHLPVDKIGASSSAPSKTAPTPEVTIDTTDDFAFTFSLRENAGSVVEKVLVENVADASLRQEFLPFRVPPVSKRLPDETRRFHIVNADGANLSVARRTGSSGPVKYLFERRAAELKSGQTTLFGNLLYSEDIGERKDWTTTQLSDSVVLAHVGAPVLVGATSFDSTDLQVNAALFCISSESVALADVMSLATKAARLIASAPIDVELDLVAKQGTLVATVPTEVTLPGTERSVHLEPGRHVLPLPGADAFCDELAAALQRIARGAGQRQARNPVPGAPVASRALREMWRIGEPERAELPEIRDVQVARLAKDGLPHVFVCRGSDLLCLTGSGTPAWTFSAERRLRCVTIADLDRNGVPEVLCGGDDEHIRILDTAGKEQAKHRMVERLVVGQGGTRLPYVNCLATEDLDGDGHPEIIAGCSNSQISAFDRGFSRIWNLDGVFHGVREVRCADLDNDGRPEVLAADHYGSVNIISADGKTRTRVYSELGDVAFGTGDMDGDGRRELVNGSSTGALSAYAYPAKSLFTFNNYGYAVRAILLMDTDGDGKDETLVASDTGYLYALDAKGAVKWQVGFGAAVLHLASGRVLKGGTTGIVTGQRDGLVRVLDREGKTMSTHALGAPVKLLRCADVDGDGHDEIIAVDDANRLVVLGR